MMKTQFNQEFIFEREFLAMSSDWNRLSSDSDFDSLFEPMGDAGEVPYSPTSFLWEELEGVNKFIDLAGY